MVMFFDVERRQLPTRTRVRHAALLGSFYTSFLVYRYVDDDLKGGPNNR
jgi:hypothetical protein